MKELADSLWSILKHASGSDWENGSALKRLLRELCDANDVDGASLDVYGKAGDTSQERTWRMVASAGTDRDSTDSKSFWHGEHSLSASVRLSLWKAGDAPEACSEDDGLRGMSPQLAVTLAAGAQLADLARRLKAQSFQDNYRVVTMEALYDVGLAIASTLNLDELTDGILLRAVSLLDARRGALYLLQNGRYELEGTIGGDAVDAVVADDERLEALSRSAEDCNGLEDLLPGSTHCLAVPIAVDTEALGLLALADKESRTGIGPFAQGDQRALSLFANQAAIALENAKLHRQALEKERLEREMELAADIQRGILPSETPTLGDVELIGWNRPTRQVGGDYYGWLKLHNGHTGMVVADVTGKGMPAALLVNTLHSALDLLLDSNEPGVGLVERLNQHVAESSRSNKFITMIMMTLSPDSHTVNYINAGHNPGVLVRSDGSHELLNASGLPLGLLPHSSYELGQIELHSGDLVCLYSDGITECESPDEEEYGLERLVEFLAKRRTEELSKILKDMEQDVTRFAAGAVQHDDQTVVLVRRR